MKSKQSKFILLIVAIIVIVTGIGFVANKTQNPSKYDAFAKALTAGGAEFYGAFWCPHCQAQKALFGNSKKYLPYIECSNPDQSSTQICIDKKIESFPTWIFKNGITLKSEDKPIVCQIKSEAKNEDPICTNMASAYYKTWIFPNYKFTIKSEKDPIQKDSIWSFPAGSETTGEIPLEFLAEQIGYNLEQ